MGKSDLVTARDISRDRNPDLMTRGDTPLDPRHGLHCIIGEKGYLLVKTTTKLSIFLELLEH